MSDQSPDSRNGYVALVAELKERIAAARVRAALAINSELILLYWEIGNSILARQREEGWGTRVVDRLTKDLRQAFPEMTGLSARNLKYMRAFAGAYPNRQFVQQVAAQIPWGHNMVLLDAVKCRAEREWYMHQTIEQGWSRNVLVHQIDSGLYVRQGKALTNFARTLPAPQSELAQQLIKDPYSFEFLSLGPEMLERDLERGLIEHLRKFILELGKGFAFVGSQYHLVAGGQDYYLDLLFYHLRLRCFVVFDLKIEDFKPEFAGKMNFYLSAVDDLLRHQNDEPSIGIILCKGRNEVIVEYALRDTSKPVGVASYRVMPALPDTLRQELPTAEELASELPALSLLKLRIDIERALHNILVSDEVSWHPTSIGAAIRELQSRGVAPPSTNDFLKTRQVMNQAAHSIKVDPAAADHAIKIAKTFLDELKNLGGPSSIES